MLRVEGLVRDPQSSSSKLGTTDSLSLLRETFCW